MLNVLLSLRFVMLFAALGAFGGALLMFWIGGAGLARAALALAAGEDIKALIGAVMSATDAFLFGIVLVIFAYSIVLGFVLELPADVRDRLPEWMRVQGIAELKHTLIEVTLVYLVVDFATTLTQAETPLPWETLVEPVSILLIAGALRLLGTASGREAAGSAHPGPRL